MIFENLSGTKAAGSDVEDAALRDMPHELGTDAKKLKVVEAGGHEDVLPPLHDEPTDDDAAKFIHEEEEKLKQQQ